MADPFAIHARAGIVAFEIRGMLRGIVVFAAYTVFCLFTVISPSFDFRDPRSKAFLTAPLFCWPMLLGADLAPGLSFGAIRRHGAIWRQPFGAMAPFGASDGIWRQ